MVLLLLWGITIVGGYVVGLSKGRPGAGILLPTLIPFIGIFIVLALSTNQERLKELQSEYNSNDSPHKRYPE